MKSSLKDQTQTFWKVLGPKLSLSESRDQSIINGTLENILDYYIINPPILSVSSARHCCSSVRNNSNSPLISSTTYSLMLENSIPKSPHVNLPRKCAYCYLWSLKKSDRPQKGHLLPPECNHSNLTVESFVSKQGSRIKDPQDLNPHPYSDKPENSFHSLYHPKTHPTDKDKSKTLTDVLIP